MAFPLPERRLRNRSVCCLYPTPPPYPGYRQITDTSRDHSIKPTLINGNALKISPASIWSEISNGDHFPLIIDPELPSKHLHLTHNRHRSAPRNVNSHFYGNDEVIAQFRKIQACIAVLQDTKSRIGQHQSRARKEFFHMTNGHVVNESKNGDSKPDEIRPSPRGRQMIPVNHHNEEAINKCTKDRRRKTISKTSSGYGSFSSGESDAAEDAKNGDPVVEMVDISPQGSVTSPVSSDISKSPVSPDQGAKKSKGLRAIFSEEILCILEQHGLIQNPPQPEHHPGPAVLARKSSSEYNVIELSRKYQKQELSQKKALEKVQLINDVDHLQKMLGDAIDEDQRQAIKIRMAELIKNRTASPVANVLSPPKANPSQQKSMSPVQSQPMTNADANQEIVEPQPMTDGGVEKSENSPPPKEQTPTAIVGGIASLTRAQQLSVPNENGSTSAEMATPDVKPVAPKPVARTASEIKSALLRWCQAKTKGYPHVNITNYSKSWCDGMAFCALIHHFYPDAFDFSKLDPKNRRENFELAFQTAEKLGDIAPLLEVDDMLAMGDNPEYKCVFTYVQQFYRRFHNVP